MTASVDLTNLREMTDGDVTLEQELFREFRTSADQCISSLEESSSDSHGDKWRTDAHALKGMAYNLGAKALGDLCTKAQEIHTAPPESKQELLQAIKSEYAQVMQYLDSVCA